MLGQLLYGWATLLPRDPQLILYEASVSLYPGRSLCTIVPSQISLNSGSNNLPFSACAKLCIYIFVFKNPLDLEVLYYQCIIYCLYWWHFPGIDVCMLKLICLNITGNLIILKHNIVQVSFSLKSINRRKWFAFKLIFYKI